ncbi:MAG: dTDP-4-dehydrorhamnose reductase [Candidatus Bathyarchaeia archaeon]
MKVFITGASSTPGYKIVLEFAESDYQVYAQFFTHEIPNIEGVTKIRLDLRDYAKIVEILNEIKPDVIIHTSAISDVDLCEVDKYLAWSVNVEASRVIAKKAKDFNAKLVYLSTDYVFNGERGLYKENDVPAPINYYGLTKLIAENIFSSATNNHIILRTSQIYGFGMGRVNFARFVIDALSKGQRIKALTDQWLSPTLNTLLAKAIKELVEGNHVGLFHVAGERTSRYEFARIIAKKFGFDESLIEPVTMDEISFRAKRPRDSSLDSSKAKNMLEVDFYTLENSLNLLHREWMRIKHE